MIMLQFLLSIADESDHAKIEYVYYHYRDEMLRVAKARLRRVGVPNYELDAEDAVQNAFVKIVKYIHRIDFTAEDKAIRAYILRIVVNEAMSVAKDHQATDDISELADRIEDGDFFGQMRVQERYEDVVEAIGKLDERYSIPLSLRYAENMEIKEIAELLGIAEKSVYTRLERARKMLIDMLNGGKS